MLWRDGLSSSSSSSSWSSWRLPLPRPCWPPRLPCWPPSSSPPLPPSLPLPWGAPLPLPPGRPRISDTPASRIRAVKINTYFILFWFHRWNKPEVKAFIYIMKQTDTTCCNLLLVIISVLMSWPLRRRKKAVTQKDTSIRVVDKKG